MRSVSLGRPERKARQESNEPNYMVGVCQQLCGLAAQAGRGRKFWTVCAKSRLAAADGDRLALTLLGQGAFHAFRVVSNHGQIGAGGLIGRAASLLPIPQGAYGDVIPGGEFFLRQGKGST